jgi:competence protein ComEC
VAAAFGGGIAVQPWVPTALAWAVWLIALAGTVLLVATRWRWAWLPLLAGVAALGTIRAGPAPIGLDHVARLALPLDATIEGSLAAEPTRLGPDRLRVLFEVSRVNGEPRSGRVQLTIYGGAHALTAGQRVRARCRLHPAIGFRNPGGFDHAAALARQDVHVVASARPERFEVLDHPRPPWNVRVRQRALAAIEAGLPPASAALLGGLVLGVRTDLPREMDQGFRTAGVYHVLAVSGFNVALLSTAVLALLALARVPPRLAALVAIVVVVGFGLVVGPQPSVLRAALMAVLVLAALLLERDVFVVNSLALAALVLLAARPGDLGDPGFQLSFAATAGIVMAPVPRRRLPAALAVSAAAQAAVLPIQLAHFNAVSIAGVIANLVVVPLAAVATVLGVAAIALEWMIPAGATVLLDAAWPVVLAMRAAVALVAAVPGALVHLPAPPWPGVVAWGAALALARLGWAVRESHWRAARRLGGAASVLALVAVLVEVWPIVRPPDGRLRVTVLDVGQGDAIVVEAPDGRVLVIDAGPGGSGRLDTGERVVAPFLWNRGILRLAATVTTHDDVDHAGGMPALRRLFTVSEDWDAWAPGSGPRFIGGVVVTALAPPAGAGAHGPRRRRNDEAVVLRLDHGLASFLLASDIGPAREAALVAGGHPLQARVLKVSHHGARGSTTAAFLDAVRPAIAVISVGPRNSYGHPAPPTLARLAAAGAIVGRTDRDGAVILETDGRLLTVTRWATAVVERFCLEPETRCEETDDAGPADAASPLPGA